MGNTWRDTCRPIIAKAIADNKPNGDAAVKKALHKAYPFGERKYHPYKVWLDEIRVQLKKRKFGKKNIETPKEQTSLF